LKKFKCEPSAAKEKKKIGLLKADDGIHHSLEKATGEPRRCGKTTI
jgi:hypothetical protein